MKAWTIAWKDTLIRFRDVNALLFMLAAPLLITAIIGSAFSGFFSDDGDVPITDIPFIIVDGDETESSEQLIALFTDDETLSELLATEQMDDLDAAKRRVMVGESRAVLYIPAGFGVEFDDLVNDFPELFICQIQALFNFFIMLLGKLIKILFEYFYGQFNDFSLVALSFQLKQ